MAKKTSTRTPGDGGNGTSVASLAGRVIGRHKALLSDPKVLSWWEARSLRSRLSADQYLRQLGLLLERTELAPTSMLELAQKDPDRLRDLLFRDAARLKKEGKLDSYISKFYEGLKSYFRFQRIQFDGYPALSPIKGASLGNERVPSPEELGRILDHLSLRGRVLALFMAHAGVRPGVLGAYQGENGLRLSDLPDLQLNRKKTAFAKTPFIIQVPANLSKTRVSYVTFGSSQLTHALLTYLEERSRGGEPLCPDSPVVAGNAVRGVALLSRRNAQNSKGFLSTKVVVEEIRSALQAVVPRGVRWRPYVLRAYCSTRLLMAESAGKITRDLREAILGHDGGVAARYDVGKRWGDELLNEARAAYKRCEPFLSTGPVEKEEDRNVITKAALLEMFGYSEKAAEQLLADPKTDVGKLIRDRLGLSATPTETAALAPKRGGEQRVIEADATASYLDAGWTFKSPLNGTKAVVEWLGPVT